MNNVRDLRLLVIFIGIAMLTGIKYWNVDVDNKYECVSYYLKDNEVENVDVIIKGKYGKSIFRGERFEGTVSIDDKIYPYMFSDRTNIIVEGVAFNKVEFEHKSDDVISSKVFLRRSVKGFDIGYEFGENLWFKYNSFGYLYFDDGMNNIVIDVNSSYIEESNMTEEKGHKLIVSKDNKAKAMQFINEFTPFLNK